MLNGSLKLGRPR